MSGDIILAGTIGSSDTLKYFSFYSSPDVRASVRNLSLSTDRRLRGSFVVVKDTSSFNNYADTLRGTFDVQLQPMQQVQRVGR